MKKKILIIGFGGMGLSHFSSIPKKKYIIHIIEKKLNKDVNNLKRMELFKKNIFIFNNLPNRQNYLLTIISTKSKERFNLAKNFFKNKNKTKFMLLEKFCFLTLKQFDQFNSRYKNKTKCYINSWAYILAKKINIKKRLKKFKLVCHIKENLLLANITHLFHFFNYLTNQNPITKLIPTKCSIIKNNRIKFYDELKGKILIEDANKNQLIIKTRRYIKNAIHFYIFQNSPNINCKIFIKNDRTIDTYTLGKRKQFNFPVSKITTKYFLNNCIKSDFEYMPTFDKDYEFSKLILKKFDGIRIK